MKIAFWSPQIDIKKSFFDRGHKTVALDWHKGDWQKDFLQADCTAYVWYPHALHAQWQKLPDRAGFIELFMKRRAFPDFRTSFLFQNKMHQEYVFAQLSVPRPKTFILTSADEVAAYLKKPLAFPVVAKDMWQYGGFGVELITDQAGLTKYIAQKKMPAVPEKVLLKHYIYLQEYIALKEEYRVLTVGQKIILAYRKRSDEFLGHVWRGADVDFDVKKDVKDFVWKYNRALKLDCCGWDIARDKQGKLKIIELNPIAGTKILEEQGISLAEAIAEHVSRGLK